MQPPVDAQSVTIQYGSYFEELHEFFRMASMPYGVPEDLNAFIERLSEPGPFPENVSALIWSILFQEREQISAHALTNLLAVAVGGPTVEDESGKMEGPLRVLLGFVMGALRSRRNMAPEELPSNGVNTHQSNGGDMTTGSRRDTEFTRAILAASQIGSSHSETRTHSPALSQFEGDQAPAIRNEAVHPPLFAKWSDAITRDYVEKPPVSGWPWRIVVGLALGLLAVGAAIFLTRNGLWHPKAVESASGKGSVVTDGDRKSSGSQAAWCVSPMLSSTSREDLDARYKAAKTLIDQNRASEALPRLQEIALADPGFPMINLNISEAWLKLKQMDEAKAALDAQYAVSGCLAKLPATGLASYCSSEFPNTTPDACRTQIAGMWQAAHTQGALMQLAASGGDAPSSGSPTVRARAAVRMPPSAAEAVAQRKAVSTETRPPRRSSDRSLVDGEGTDASLGAYPKQ